MVRPPVGVPDPSNGQVLVRNIYLSVDPAMRGWVSAVANYSEPVALGAGHALASRRARRRVAKF
jgi:NADPH-dependent curcumin reductase CurA